VAKQVVGQQDHLSSFLRVRVVDEPVTRWIPVNTERAREELHATHPLSRYEPRIG